MKWTIQCRCVCGCILFVVFLTTCAPAPLRISSITSLGPVQREKVPIKLGYFVNPEYCELIWKAKPPYTYSYFIGESMCTGVETLLATAFRDVVRLPSVDAGFKSQNINALATLDILQIDINTNRNTVFIKIKWAIHDSDKNILWADTITGNAHKICMAKWCRKEIVEAAFRDQFQKTLESLLRGEWWRSIK